MELLKTAAFNQKLSKREKKKGNSVGGRLTPGSLRKHASRNERGGKPKKLLLEAEGRKGKNIAMRLYHKGSGKREAGIAFYLNF